MKGPLLHVGLHKTGTTSIQAFLRDHTSLLHSANWRFPTGFLQLNCHFELGMALMRPNRMFPSRSKGDDWLKPHWRTDLLMQVVEEISRRDERTIISCEELSLFRYPDELADLRSVVGDATIVLYLRNADDWLASQRVELSKPTNMGLSSDPDACNYLEPDSWLVDYDRRIEGFTSHFSDVRVLDYDAELEADGSIIPSFCRTIGVQIPDDAAGYWLNTRGTINDGRVPGTRWCGGSFGDPIVPTTSWQHEWLRRRGLVDAAERARLHAAKSPAARS